MPLPFVDDKDGPHVARLVAFHNRHTHASVAFTLVVFANLCLRVLHGKRIGGIAGLDACLGSQGVRGNIVVAGKNHLSENRPFDDAENLEVNVIVTPFAEADDSVLCYLVTRQSAVIEKLRMPIRSLEPMPLKRHGSA